ncbi:Fur family transcriptional regulator [Rhodococcus sp. X156]|uniref:Fur family transcriptional regulator n=1 Tax=Rhodococcus sp. X156 TaxID=2499145 RepID=UPI000FD6F564|nr:Fur family transcriptional regulator [Rhodococcus sp. X156]
MTPAASSAAARVRAAGLRVTKPRVAVLEALEQARLDRQHLPAGAILEQVRPVLGSVSTQTVYDCLDALTRAGLLRSIEPAGHPVRYETHVPDDHHHLVCRGCGQTSDVPALAGSDACVRTAPVDGFRVEATEVIFWGWCPSCAATTQPGQPLERHDSP